MDLLRLEPQQVVAMLIFVVYGEVDHEALEEAVEKLFSRKIDLSCKIMKRYFELSI